MYFNEEIDIGLLAFHVACILCLLCILYLVLVMFNYSDMKCWAQEVYVVLGLMIVAYYVAGDGRTLTGETTMNNHLAAVLTVLLLKQLLFENFKALMIVTMPMLVAWLPAILPTSDNSRSLDVGDFLILCLVVFFILISSRVGDLRARHIFWRKDKEAKSMMKTELNPGAEEKPLTEVEDLIQLVIKVKDHVKGAVKVIMFDDVKEKLKNAVLMLERIKFQIAKGMSSTTNHLLEKNSQLDDEDKAFIAHFFMPSSFSLARSGTLKSLPESRAVHFGLEKYDAMLATVGRNWSFDIWFIFDSTEKSLSILGPYLFKQWSFNEAFAIPEAVTERFFIELEAAYPHNPYHNACHSADVTHTMLYFLNNSSLMSRITTVDLVSTVVACAAHDINHPALNNRFLVNTYHDLAIQYNDISVLESMHCSLTFQLLMRKECNIFVNMAPDDWRIARKTIISMILATDMGKHFELLSKFRARHSSGNEIDLENEEDRFQVLNLGIKCADLGHSCKKPDLHQRWTNLIVEELFTQGDIEKARGLPVSMYCDRETTDLPKSQAGFVNNICLPLVEAWCNYLNAPLINENCLEQIKSNGKYWESMGQKRRATTLAVPPEKYSVYKRNSDLGGELSIP
eukprot:CAMPEP_0204911428 /NCGR_PEP_ID=MMETSP1397-20131031/9778_1 /ASSEMBLY_ACC=CAM_ASM_000891 /TAXON_ID=49980 /ORGANISM="Climacostomum Climacostomum virens, Strain Stock W-24" /LENGTH=625 /DNA_ID=CAMNT_0052081979 /DNA_START=195 /DNA_END=2068 /DNA_ORIENTATION=+